MTKLCKYYLVIVAHGYSRELSVPRGGYTSALAEFKRSNQRAPSGPVSGPLARMQGASQRVTHTLALAIRLSPRSQSVVANDRAGPSMLADCLPAHTRCSREGL